MLFFPFFLSYGTDSELLECRIHLARTQNYFSTYFKRRNLPTLDQTVKLTPGESRALCLRLHVGIFIFAMDIGFHAQCDRINMLMQQLLNPYY